MTKLNLRRVSVRTEGQALVKGADLDFDPGELVAILGANGAGKTTLLRAALGFIRPDSGEALLAEKPSYTLKPAERAHWVSYLPQTRPLAWPLSVFDVVALGRFAHGASLGRLLGPDQRAVDAAMTACDITHLADRSTATLSGGELARTQLARAFAAQTPLLVADEPVAALDPRQQIRVMELLQGFVAQGGGALVVLHDIALAARYADRLIWMAEGEIIADGPVRDTLTSEILRRVYGVTAEVFDRSGHLNIHIEGAA